jgi:transposase
MGRRLLDDIANRVLVHFKAGESIKSIHKATKVSMSCLYKLRLNFDLWGIIYPPPTVKLGRPRILEPDQELVIKFLFIYFKAIF